MVDTALNVHSLVIFSVCVISGLLFYLPSYTNYFVADDFEFAGRITFRDASGYFTKGFGGGNEYRPLLPLTYALDEQVGRGSPVPFHITNTIIHAANAFLIYSIAQAFALTPATGLCAMILFLLNPVAHEPLLWISGRPVLLGTFFVLLTLRFFMSRRPAALIGAWLSLLFALGIYELGVVVPFLLAAVCVLPKFRNRAQIVTVVGSFVITGFYVGFWLHLFRFQITRFPVEHTAAGMVSSLATAITHSFHGSNRLFPGLVYGILILNLCRARELRVLSFSFLVFVIGYIPFFLVHGFADRFAYLSSTAAAVCLARSVTILPNRKPWFAAAVLAIFFSIGMQTRIKTWHRAGELAKEIPHQLQALAPGLAPGSTIVFRNAPLMYKQAYVFISGLNAAIENQYRFPLTVIQKETDQSSGRLFRWTGEQVVELPRR